MKKGSSIGNICYKEGNLTSPARLLYPRAVCLGSQEQRLLRYPQSDLDVVRAHENPSCSEGLLNTVNPLFVNTVAHVHNEAFPL